MYVSDRSSRYPQALMLMYAIALILRGREDSDDIWLDEWFPKEGYGKSAGSHLLCFRSSCMQI